MGACVAVAAHLWWLALVLWLVNRLFDGLAGATARASGATDLGGCLDIVADFSIYYGFVLAGAIAVPLRTYTEGRARIPAPPARRHWHLGVAARGNAAGSPGSCHSESRQASRTIGHQRARLRPPHTMRH